MSSLQVVIFIPQAGSNCSFAVSPSFPLSHLQLFPSQITDLVTFASLLTLPSPNPPSPCYVSPFCPNLWPLGFWGKAEVAFEDGDGQVYSGPQQWMHAFVHVSLTSSYPVRAAPQQSLSPPHSHTQTLSSGPPYCTNDPANYVFKVFGSCENSFGLAVEGGGAVGEQRVRGDVGWSMGSWLSWLPRLLCKHWIRAARVDWGELVMVGFGTWYHGSVIWTVVSHPPGGGESKILCLWRTPI